MTVTQLEEMIVQLKKLNKKHQKLNTQYGKLYEAATNRKTTDHALKRWGLHETVCDNSDEAITCLKALIRDLKALDKLGA